jgi:hypothetical protein
MYVVVNIPEFISSMKKHDVSNDAVWLFEMAYAGSKHSSAVNKTQTFLRLVRTCFRGEDLKKVRVAMTHVLKKLKKNKEEEVEEASQNESHVIKRVLRPKPHRV